MADMRIFNMVSAELINRKNAEEIELENAMNKDYDNPKKQVKEVLKAIDRYRNTVGDINWWEQYTSQLGQQQEQRVEPEQPQIPTTGE